MKAFLKSAAAVLLLSALPAAAVVMPMRIPFQGKLIDPATNGPKNGAFAMVFKIWDAPTGGNTLFTESQTVTVVNGQFNVQIGTITYLNADMLSGTSAYLGVTVGADAEMAPRQPLSMSPYAYTAVQLASDKVIRINSGITYSTFTTGGNLTLQYGITGTTVTFANITSTGVGTFGIVTSSGISMGDGTLKISANSEGIDASGTGIVAGTATFANVTSTGVGTFGIATSSGISIALGTLKVAAASRGIDASGTGIVAGSATFANISSTGVGSAFGITVSSGFTMLDGVLKVGAASDGIDASGTGILASTGVFTSSVTAQQFFGIGVTTAAVKTITQPITSNAALANDNELNVPVGTNQTWIVNAYLDFRSANATPDAKVAIGLPAGGTLSANMHMNGTTAATFTDLVLAAPGVAQPVLLGANIPNPVFLNGSITTGGTAGFINIQWAQNTSNAAAVNLSSGSYISATRVK